MLDIKFIREHPEQLKDALKKRNVIFDVEYLLAQDLRRRAKITEVDRMRQEQNTLAKEIARMDDQDREKKKVEGKELKTRLANAEFELKILEEEFTDLMYKLPNIPHADAPSGKNETNNQEIHREDYGREQFSFTPCDYITISEKLELIDTRRAAKAAGTRFGYLRNEAALLEFALVQFVFDRLTQEDWVRKAYLRSARKKNRQTLPLLEATPFIPLVPPVMIRPEIFRAMGKLDPGQEEERYFIPKDSLYLVGSAEHTTGAMYKDEVLEKDTLPRRFIAFSTCFRREAGSYGKDTKGILRVHQFDKLEMFSFCHPDYSFHEHDFFRAVQESLMEELQIPYRTMLICTGDMVWTDAKQYDIESWLPGQNGGNGEFRETHSTSNSTDFQSRRLNIKFHDSSEKDSFVHTVNGTACAIGRTIIAILENYQQEDGSVKIPEALKPYMHGITEIRR